MFKGQTKLGGKPSKITCTIMVSVTQRKQQVTTNWYKKQGSTTAKFMFLY